MLELTLDAVERFMQAYIVHPGDAEDALHDAAHGCGLGADAAARLVLPRRQLTPQDRLDIYRDQYLARMDEALSGDFPGVKRCLGEDAWDQLVHDYVEAHPSRSYTLNRLGDHFAAYLADRPDLRRGAFVRDLARLEQAVTEVFDAPQTPVLQPEQVAAVAPQAWDGARLLPVSALRILALGHNVDDYLEAVQAEAETLPSTARKNTWVVVFRHDFHMHRQALSRPQYDMLSALADGTPLGTAFRALARRKSVRDGEVAGWFGTWIAHGLWQGIEVAR